MRGEVKVLSLILLIVQRSFAGVPAPASFYADQLVDHLGSDAQYKDRRWSQRYYLSSDHYMGPGSPIFVIMGGEGAIEPTKGFAYPFVMQMAQNFGAIVLQPEHRFYGASQPITAKEIENERHAGKPDPRAKLLTAEQALNDAVRLIKLVQIRAQCSPARNSSHYCPVITVGGSYPGFLSAMARFRFPDVIDMSYAASAPMYFYAQQVQQNAYYEHISKIAEEAFPGCSLAVRDVLSYFVSFVEDSPSIEAEKIGVCKGTMPSYIKTKNDFVNEVVMMVGYTFANYNMAFYPPTRYTALAAACYTFADPRSDHLDRLRSFLVQALGGGAAGCFAMSSQLPSGPNATISSGDWSGVGTGHDGESWDFQTCSLLVEAIGFSNDSMFPYRLWSVDWLDNHCRSRFGVTPAPKALVQSWGFDDLVGHNASYIIFTNGLLDGWSVSGIQEDLSDTLLAYNFPNGAHHSDLSGHFPSQSIDTPDILAGQAQIQLKLATWIAEIKSQAQSRSA